MLTFAMQLTIYHFIGETAFELNFTSSPLGKKLNKNLNKKTKQKIRIYIQDSLVKFYAQPNEAKQEKTKYPKCAFFHDIKVWVKQYILILILLWT